MKQLLVALIVVVSMQVSAKEQQIIYQPSDGKIIARISVEDTVRGLGPDRAVIVADMDESSYIITHVTEETVPVATRKKAVKPKKAKDITADSVAAVDALIEAVSDKKTQDALKALKALIVEELPAE